MTVRPRFDNTTAALQTNVWPPAERSVGLDHSLQSFIELDEEEAARYLQGLRAGAAESYQTFLQRALASIYAYVYGYHDSPCYLNLDPAIESKLLQAKVRLEHELLRYGITWTSESIRSCPVSSQADLSVRLRALVADNPGVRHSFFDYLAHTASREELREFLLHEVVRNEVVDDEVAFLSVGQQGSIKNAVAMNYHDEVGRGVLVHFHTYWLREYLEENHAWNDLLQFRAHRPWFSYLSSNVFNFLLTRPGLKKAALGYFIVTESWVHPHFEKLLTGMARVGITHGIRYFTAHSRIDPLHAEELITSVEQQHPPLTAVELHQVISGAEIAVAVGIATYDAMSKYFTRVLNNT